MNWILFAQQNAEAGQGILEKYGVQGFVVFTMVGLLVYCVKVVGPRHEKAMKDLTKEQIKGLQDQTTKHITSIDRLHTECAKERKEDNENRDQREKEMRTAYMVELREARQDFQTVLVEERKANAENTIRLSDAIDKCNGKGK